MVEDKKQVANIFIKFQVLHPSIYYNFTMIPYFVSGKFWIHFLDVSLIRWMGCNMKPTTTQLLRYILALEFILITIVHKHSIKLDARMEHEMGHWGGFCSIEGIQWSEGTPPAHSQLWQLSSYFDFSLANTDLMWFSSSLTHLCIVAHNPDESLQMEASIHVLPGTYST